MPTQAQSAKLIGQAIQNNPAFLTLRKIEVSPAAGRERCGLPTQQLWLMSNTFDLEFNAGRPGHLRYHCRITEPGLPQLRLAAPELGGQLPFALRISRLRLLWTDFMASDQPPEGCPAVG